jgi:hypothetical protein
VYLIARDREVQVLPDIKVYTHSDDLQPRYLRITFPGDLRDLLVVFVNPLAQRFDSSEQRFQRRLKG